MEKILDDINFEGESIQSFRDASTGQRFVNYLIDALILYGVSELLSKLFFVSFSANYLDAGNDTFLLFLAIFINYGILVLYYTCFEAFLKGKTPGKYLTKTRAVMDDDSVIKFNPALLRNFIRIVPFEPFSFFGSTGRGWHDRWSDTKVIVDDNWSESTYI